MKLIKTTDQRFPIILYLSSESEDFGDAIGPLHNLPSISVNYTEDEETGDANATITIPNRKALWEAIIALNEDINKGLKLYMPMADDWDLGTDSLNDAWVQSQISNLLTQYEDPYSDYHLQNH